MPEPGREDTFNGYRDDSSLFEAPNTDEDQTMPPEDEIYYTNDGRALRGNSDRFDQAAEVAERQRQEMAGTGGMALTPAYPRSDTEMDEESASSGEMTRFQAGGEAYEELINPQRQQPSIPYDGTGQFEQFEQFAAPLGNTFNNTFTDSSRTFTDNSRILNLQQVNLVGAGPAPEVGTQLNQTNNDVRTLAELTDARVREIQEQENNTAREIAALQATSKKTRQSVQKNFERKLAQEIAPLRASIDQVEQRVQKNLDQKFATQLDKDLTAIREKLASTTQSLEEQGPRLDALHAEVSQTDSTLGPLAKQLAAMDDRIQQAEWRAESLERDLKLSQERTAELEDRERDRAARESYSSKPLVKDEPGTPPGLTTTSAPTNTNGVTPMPDPQTPSETEVALKEENAKLKARLDKLEAMMSKMNIETPVPLQPPPPTVQHLPDPSLPQMTAQNPLALLLAQMTAQNQPVIAPQQMAPQTPLQPPPPTVQHLPEPSMAAQNNLALLQTLLAAPHTPLQPQQQPAQHLPDPSMAAQNNLALLLAQMAPQTPLQPQYAPDTPRPGSTKALPLLPGSIVLSVRTGDEGAKSLAQQAMATFDGQGPTKDGGAKIWAIEPGKAHGDLSQLMNPVDLDNPAHLPRIPPGSIKLSITEGTYPKDLPEGTYRDWLSKSYWALPNKPIENFAHLVDLTQITPEVMALRKQAENIEVARSLQPSALPNPALKNTTMDVPHNQAPYAIMLGATAGYRRNDDTKLYGCYARIGTELSKFPQRWLQNDAIARQTFAPRAASMTPGILPSVEGSAPTYMQGKPFATPNPFNVSPAALQQALQLLQATGAAVPHSAADNTATQSARQFTRPPRANGYMM